MALGAWCRSFIDGAGGSLGIGLAQLGAPWVLVAFAVGAIVAVERADDPVLERAGLGLGALAGAAAMVVASFTYYGGASSVSAIFWAAAGMFVGGAAGLAGAGWRSHSDGMLRAVAAGALGLALVAEGIGRLEFGWFHVTGDLARLAAGWLVVCGAVVPVVLTRGQRAGFVASFAVLVLAAPVAMLVVAASHGLGLA
ncbi:MAG: hypothetical protein QOI61_1190 [Actinomycetota bacterium]|jgi:hypothetical protein